MYNKTYSIVNEKSICEYISMILVKQIRYITDTKAEEVDSIKTNRNGCIFRDGYKMFFEEADVNIFFRCFIHTPHRILIIRPNVQTVPW